MSRTITVDIGEMRARQQSPLMLLWSLNPIPRNMLGFMESKFD